MPNPFIRRQAVTSKTDVDRPVAETPIPERVRGHVFAYRGMETHGVDPNNDAQDPEDYGYMERGVTVQYEPEDNGPEPIPVIIVQHGSKEFRRFRTVRMGSGTSDGSPTAILGRDTDRRKVTIKNVSTDTVYIGHDQSSASQMHGYPLAANETMTVDAWSQIFAISSTTAVVTLAMIIEYVVDDE